VVPNDFMNDKGQELLGKVWVKFADLREMPQTTELLGFSAGIARGQSVLSLQFADSVGTAEPLREHVDDRGIDIVDAVPQVAKFGTGLAGSTITPSPSSPASATEFWMSKARRCEP
jgi:hypothetical protein